MSRISTGKPKPCFARLQEAQCHTANPSSPLTPLARLRALLQLAPGERVEAPSGLLRRGPLHLEDRLRSRSGTPPPPFRLGVLTEPWPFLWLPVRFAHRRKHGSPPRTRAPCGTGPGASPRPGAPGPPSPASPGSSRPAGADSACEQRPRGPFSYSVHRILCPVVVDVPKRVREKIKKERVPAARTAGSFDGSRSSFPFDGARSDFSLGAAASPRLRSESVASQRKGELCNSLNYQQRGHGTPSATVYACLI